MPEAVKLPYRGSEKMTDLHRKLQIEEIPTLKISLLRKRRYMGAIMVNRTDLTLLPFLVRYEQNPDIDFPWLFTSFAGNGTRISS
ncbi:hypothetical protein PIB30_017856 [Stylosanthes scabra]|uniref:Uncharacterized protein n=1 Tax=Stylosanthes scabra TaxID=79078 RepID=A0ABU6X583_9FABA|nr:hypothetical protein [Stylosanthes scabra]